MEEDFKKGRVIPYIQSIPDFVSFRVITSIIIAIILFLQGFIFRNLLKSAGKVALTSSDVAFLFTSWQGILIILNAFVIIVIYMIFEYITLVNITRRLMEGERKPVFPSIKESVVESKRLIDPKAIPIIIFIAILTPLLGVGISLSITQNFYIPTFISSVIDSNFVYSILYTVVIVVLSIVALIFGFTIHGMFLDNLSIPEAMSQSKRIMKKNWFDYIRKMAFLIMIEIFLIIFLLFVTSILIVLAKAILEFDERIMNILMAMFTAGIIGIVTYLVTPFVVMRKTQLYYSYTINDKILYPVRKRRHHFLFEISTVLIVLLTIGAAVICDRFFDELFPKTISVPIIAHRAGGVEGNENTLGGLKKAIELNAFGAEIDIQRTKDGYYVLNHDATFERVAGVDLMPSEMTLEEVKGIRINNEEVPTIEEILDESHDKLVLFVELKGDTADKQMCDDMVKLIKERGMEDEVVLISLKYDLIDYIEDTYDNIQTAYLTFISFGNIAELNCDYVGLEEESATYANISSIHNNNKKVLVWTVNDIKSQRHFLLTSADGIITDYISQANETIKELENRSDIERIIDAVLPD